MKSRGCCQCGASVHTTVLYGYEFCGPCQTKLRLQSDKTILKNARAHEPRLELTYEDEVAARLAQMEKNFAKTRVKLLHILERLSELQ